MTGESILEAAVGRGYEPEAAQAQILALLRQVGQLEGDMAFANKAVKDFQQEIIALAERNAALENGIKAVSARCYWREMGSCDLACGGRAFCDAGGLAVFAVREAKSPLTPLCKGGEKDKEHRLEACATTGG